MWMFTPFYKITQSVLLGRSMTNEFSKPLFQRLNFSFVNKTPVILQSESSECGIACLAMVCGHYGLDIDLFNFRQRFSAAPSGSNMMSSKQNGQNHAGEKPCSVVRPE